MYYDDKSTLLVSGHDFLVGLVKILYIIRFRSFVAAFFIWVMSFIELS